MESVAPAEKLWLFLVEPEKIAEWCITIRSFRHTGERSSGVGTTFSFEERAAGRLMKLNFIVTEWVTNRSLAFRMASGNLVKGYEQRYTIETTPTGSRLTITEDVKMPWGILGKFAGLFRRSFSEAHLEHMLLKLKSLAEA
jgi:uncharacterized protein YndB with AHSA1/START domain